MSIPAQARDLTALYERLREIQSFRLAPNTVRCYSHDWKMFTTWCAETGLSSLPATSETVSLYIVDLLQNERRISTAVRRTSAITHMHRTNGHQTPVTEEIWVLLANARRMLHEGIRQMQPLTIDQLRQISGLLAGDGTVEALRNRAILVLGFTSALRRASITQLLLSDIEFVPEGTVIQIRYAKDDQEGKGRTVGVPSGQHADTCLSKCLNTWLAHRGTVDGPLFTTIRENDFRHLAPSVVGRIVKAGVQRIGLDPTRYAGHSLRSGFITAAGQAGVSHLVIAGHTGHRRMDTLRKYFRSSEVFKSNACQYLDF